MSPSNSNFIIRISWFSKAIVKNFTEMIHRKLSLIYIFIILNKKKKKEYKYQFDNIILQPHSFYFYDCISLK